MRKALITAGGRATRLRPITHTMNKHLIPLAGKPMIVHVIEKIVEAGITEIIVNVNPGDRELPKLLGDGGRWGASVRCVEQTGGPLGLGHILRVAEPYIGAEPFLFYLGDNIILGSIRRFVERFRAERLDCLLALARVPDPQRFGVPELRDGRIVRVEEKPSAPKSPYAVTGIYLYQPVVFDAARAITPSARGELEISDVHTWLIERGHAVGYEEITGWWKDTGKPQDLLEGNQLLLGEPSFQSSIGDASIAEGAVLQGRVRLGAGTRIEGRSLIRGPVVIGARCVIRDSYIGPYTTIGDEVTVIDTEVEHAIVFDGAQITAGRRVVDSIIGTQACACSSWGDQGCWVDTCAVRLPMRRCSHGDGRSAMSRIALRSRRSSRPHGRMWW
ncbi:glucose-1-phosphate thymidylyltransferase [Candidatus Uhrbacteria bacterium]|nr:glucose-1-phosphate thymidylyltransferase [Candidatus Uhrbacteria bacterium]